jgi:isopenicillin N synthase-like dioxygenase
MHAMATMGFFYAVDHGVDNKFIREKAAEFFTIPLEDKQAIHLNKSPHMRGWTAIDEEITKGSQTQSCV